MKQTLNSGVITPNIFDEIKQYSNKCRTYNSNEYFPNQLRHLLIHCIKSQFSHSEIRMQRIDIYTIFSAIPFIAIPYCHKFFTEKETIQIATTTVNRIRPCFCFFRSEICPAYTPKIKIGILSIPMDILE